MRARAGSGPGPEAVLIGVLTGRYDIIPPDYVELMGSSHCTGKWTERGGRKCSDSQMIRLSVAPVNWCKQAISCIIKQVLLKVEGLGLETMIQNR